MKQPDDDHPPALPPPPAAPTPTPYPRTPPLPARPLLEQSGNDPALGAAPTYTPARYDITNPAKETTYGQVQTLLDDDSPLLQRARARAYQQSNARGLLNTNLAVQSGEQAVYDTAYEIAKHDAPVYRQANVATQDAVNEQRKLTQAEQGANDRAQLQHDVDLLKTRMDHQTRRDLGVLEVQHKLLAEASTQSAALYRELLGQIQAISVSTLPESEKRKAIDTQINTFKASLELLEGVVRTSPPDVANLNLRQYFPVAS